MAQGITGATRLYAIIGDPIAQAKSPVIYNDLFAKAAIPAVLVPIHIESAVFETAAASLAQLANLDGVLITIPYKTRIIPFVRTLGQTAQRVGAVNALCRDKDGSWIGDMFDGQGLVAAFRATGQEPRGHRVMLLGAGGAGAAIADAFAEAGAASIAIFDVDATRAAELAKRVKRSHIKCAVDVSAPTTENKDILINATPVGMAGNASPIDVARLHRDLFVVDIVPQPEITPLLSAAQEMGCAILTGRAMIQAQAAKIMEFFGFAA